MIEQMEKVNHPCWAPFVCCYKVNDSCHYWDQLKAMLSKLQQEQHKGTTCCLDLIGTSQEPCLELDDEGLKRGIGNVLGFKK
ncbi:hypothetical protein ACFLTV_00785 [Chloroflexota bacterium]